MPTTKRLVETLDLLANAISEADLQAFYGRRYRFRPAGRYTVAASLNHTRPSMFAPVFVVLQARYPNLPAPIAIENEADATAFGKKLASVVTDGELDAVLNALDRLRRYRGGPNGGDKRLRGTAYKTH